MDDGGETSRRYLSLIRGNIIQYAMICGSFLIWWTDDGLYLQLVVEDSLAEWSSFWVFMLSGVVLTARAFRMATAPQKAFNLLAAIFFAAVAMEEISWGQRFLDYLPGEYFLNNNYQEEANLHNLVDPAVLNRSFMAIVSLYGLISPALARKPALGALFGYFGFDPSDRSYYPTYVLILAATLFTPNAYGNEVQELAFGYTVLVDAVAKLRARRPSGWRALVGAQVVICVLALAYLTILATGVHDVRDARLADQAMRELSALRRDFRAQGDIFPISKGFDMRLRQFASRGLLGPVRLQNYADLAGKNAETAHRARYFLDPWNRPYWIADRYDGGDRKLFLYSEGPNGRADKVITLPEGDDIVIFITQ